MQKVLVSLPSGAGVMRADYGLLVTGDVARCGGTYLREEDRFHPAKAPLDGSRCVVGGLLPPGAVSAEAIDDRGNRVPATVGDGAYVAVLEQLNDGHEPVVCCRDANGEPVRRPWAADYPSVRVTDARTPCPACGATDWDEYTPFEEWRGGSGSKVDGTHVANPVVSCRVCGHEEPEGSFVSYGAEPSEPEDEQARAARIARARAEQRRRRWLSDSLTLRAARFPIYAAEGWPARLGGSRSRGDALTEITVDHDEGLAADPYNGDRPCLAITTKREESSRWRMLREARDALESWVRHGAGAGRWPDASHAAITLSLSAREREARAAVFGATRSEHEITVDGVAATLLVLRARGDRWAGVVQHADLTVVVSARDVDPASLRLEPIGDPAASLLGPEPSDP